MGDKYSQMPRARETRLCSPDSVNRVTLRLPRLAGQFQGRVPTLAARVGAGDWRGRGGTRKRETSAARLCVALLGTEGGERGSWGVWVRPGGAHGPQRAGRPPARRFPAPTSPGRRRRRRWAARDLSELATAEEDHVPSSRRS